MGFSNVGLGINHSMVHTLFAYYDVLHGVACAMLLPNAMEFNTSVIRTKYKDIAIAMGVDVTGMLQEEYRATIPAVKKLSASVGIPTKCEKVVASDALNDATYEDVVALFKELM